MNTETKSRRQLIDDAQAALDKAFRDQGDAEGKQMQLVANLEIQNLKVVAAVKAVDAARVQYAHAVSAPEAQLLKTDPVGDADKSVDDDTLFAPANGQDRNVAAAAAAADA